jgi:F0F1-type ATP synthase assembly protein I
MSDKKKKKRPNRFLRLSGIGAQMAVTVYLGATAGKWLDEKYPSNKKWFTIGLTLFAVALSLYSILRQVNELNKQDDEDNN